MLKGKLPDGDNKYIKEGGCTIMDTIDFLIKNLEEMNRAWIRMSLNASPEDLPILENERKEMSMYQKKDPTFVLFNKRIN